MYGFLRKLFFLFDAEKAHYLAMNTLSFLCYNPFLKKIISSRFTINHASLHTELFGLTFKNPVGLGAGFDKNARYLRELEALGFGFVEIGTVTPKPEEAAQKFAGGQINFKTESKAPVIHLTVGKLSFKPEQLTENIKQQ